jgi:hypothetical protein
MEKSSSKYNLCADFGLSFVNKIKWYIYCLKNNKNSQFSIDTRLQIKNLSSLILIPGMILI